MRQHLGPKVRGLAHALTSFTHSSLLPFSSSLSGLAPCSGADDCVCACGAEAGLPCVSGRHRDPAHADTHPGGVACPFAAEPTLSVICCMMQVCCVAQHFNGGFNSGSFQWLSLQGPLSVASSSSSSSRQERRCRHSSPSAISSTPALPTAQQINIQVHEHSSYLAHI